MSMCGRQRSDAMIVFRFKAPTQTRGVCGEMSSKILSYWIFCTLATAILWKWRRFGGYKKKKEVRQQAWYLLWRRRRGTYVASHVGWLLYKQMRPFDKNFSLRFKRWRETLFFFISFVFFLFLFYFLFYFFQMAMDEKLFLEFPRHQKIVQLIISVLMDFQVTLFSPHHNKFYFLWRMDCEIYFSTRLDTTR